MIKVISQYPIERISTHETAVCALSIYMAKSIGFWKDLTHGIMQVPQIIWNNEIILSLSSSLLILWKFLFQIIFKWEFYSLLKQRHPTYKNHGLGSVTHRADSFSHDPAQYAQPSWCALHTLQHRHHPGWKCLFADRWQQKATFWQLTSLCNLMHLGTMRSYSFSTSLTHCDVLRNLSHWIYYCKSQSSVCKDPVCSQTALQETSGIIRVVCLIIPQLLEGMPWHTASALTQNSAKVPKAAWDLHCSISRSHFLPKALPPTEHTEFMFIDWCESSDTKSVPPNIPRDSCWCSKPLLCQELILTPDSAFWLLKAAFPRPVRDPAQNSGLSFSEA